MSNSQLNNRRPQLIPFLMAGHPNLEATEILVDDLVKEGVNIIELGIPFSDPLADGPVIQKAAEESLKAGTNMSGIYALTKRLTARHPKLEIILFTYLNPLLAYGLENYVRDAKAAGVSATLTVDMPPEEATEYIRIHRAHELGTVFLASPTTSEKRLRLINECSSSFVYYVSRAGVTGEKTELSTTLSSEVKALRSHLSHPVAVGFGISHPEHVASVSQWAEGVVIGSAFIRLLSESASFEEGRRTMREFVRSCTSALAVRK